MCQCPQSGDPHFYSKAKVEKQNIRWCQCPQSGDPHFYRAWRTHIRPDQRSCQCPQSGDPHFYKILVPEEAGWFCVNALSRAILISTSFIRRESDCYRFCVNALSRAILISTKYRRRVNMRKNKSVSMPSVGRSSFLPNPKTIATSKAVVCQCPQSGDPHFYNMQVNNWQPWIRVSMPSVGRSSFLPCPSGTGYFSRFPGLFLHVFFRIFW